MAAEDILIAQIVVNAAKLMFDIIKELRGLPSSEKKLKAARALDAAMSATNDYLDETDNLKTKRNSGKEKDLEELWRTAAKELEPLNTEFAGRLYFKANYWNDPESWTDKDIEDAKIRLSDVREEARKLSRRG